MATILFIKTSSLGDVIHHMPAITEARRHLPDARFAWVVEEAYAPLVRLHPAVDETVPVASRRWRGALLRGATWREARAFVRAVRAHAYDEIIDTQGLLRSAIISRLARGRRHGYDAASIREPLAARFYDVRHQVSRELHAIERNRALTGQVLGYAPKGDVDFGLDRGKLARPADTPYAVLLHATARPEKQWPEEGWIALGRALAASGTDLVLPWGTEPERQRGERIAAALPDARIPQRQPLDQVARLIAGARVVVGVDTGLLHLAAALRVPLVGIFVGSEPGLTGPRGQGPIAIVGRNGTTPAADEVLAALDRLAVEAT
ncbi:MAG TPA: lipopolysaccharide heptosyltransferase I [Xanthobacteraceae bacterium]|nr:lipopolysaccharide heptosyltransferase I [Xanthobacteraceae bacterium]